MANKGDKKKFRWNKKKIIALVVLIIVIISISGYFIYNYLAPHHPTLEVPNTSAETIEEEYDPKLDEIKKLYEENNDLIGWLQIDGTKIDYPVMYTPGEDYYLRRDFYKKSFTGGTLYIDKHNIMEPRDINLIIHGHNMSNGTMFADLIKYKDKNYYEDHKHIVYYTLEGKEEYEVIAVFLSKVYNVGDNVFKYYKFYGEQNQEQYFEYIVNIKTLDMHDIELSATYPERLLTLSTCDYYTTDGRLVVVAKQVK